MLQRALATLLCLLGVAAIALGIASATLWRPPDTLSATATTPDGTTMLVTDPGVLDMAADRVTARATTDAGAVVLALAPTDEVEAWVRPDAHVRVTGLQDRTTLATTVVEADEPADPAAAPAEPGAPAAAPDPTGSDLWTTEVTGDGEAELTWTAEEGRWSLLAATVGEQAGPVTLTLVWPQVVTTPWLLPGILVGSLLLVAGLVWWSLLIRRRGRQRAADGGDHAHPAGGATAVGTDVGTGRPGDVGPVEPVAGPTGTPDAEEGR